MLCSRCLLVLLFLVFALCRCLSLLICILVIVFIGLNRRALLSPLSSSSCAVDCGAVDCSAVCVVDVIGGICRICLYGLALGLLLSCALFLVSASFFVVFLITSLSYTLSLSYTVVC